MKKYIFYLSFLFVLLLPITSFAKITCSNGIYNLDIDVDKTSLKLDEKASILISSDYNYQVFYEIENPNIIDITDNIVTPKNIGETSIKVVADFKDGEEVVSACTTTLNFKVLSSDSSLKMLNLEEIDISAVFNKDTYSYEVNLPYKYEKINIIAEASSSDAKITGDGRRYLNEGDNVYDIIVTASDGTTSTYKITIHREDANDDSTLKSLIVEGYLISPTFSSDTYEYNLNVSEDTEKIKINAEANYNLAKILGTGEYSLATGENKFYLTVMAENGSESKYTLTINRNKGNSRLEKLEVVGLKLDPDFDPEKFTYYVDIYEDIKTLEIIANAKDNDQVEIIGNEDLVDGENEIIIRVSSEHKGTTTYKIIANKLSAEEIKEVEKNTLLVKILLIMFIISIIIMFTFIGIFLKRNYKRKSITIKLDKNKKKKEKIKKTKKK